MAGGGKKAMDDLFGAGPYIGDPCTRGYNGVRREINLYKQH